MFNPYDPFGKMMVKNFGDRGCPLKGMDFFESIEKITERYTKIFNENSSENFTFEIYHMNDLVTKCLDQTEYQR